MQVNKERLNRFFNPQSIAVVGGVEAEQVLYQSRKLSYGGPMWAVNRNRQSMAGIKCVADIADLPDIPDAVFIGIPAVAAIEMVARLRAMGAGGAVCLASGFGEVDDGGDRQRRLIEAAGEMPVLGPNCYGYINTLLGAALFPDQHGLVRTDQGVAIISCSGNIGINFTLQQRNLPISWLITIGNQAVIGMEEALDAALDNHNIEAVGLHIEGLTDMPRFIELVQKARDLGKPIIVLKTGKSDIGARITMSHTATLAGESGLYAALFRRIGVALVNNIEEFLEALKLACVVGPLPGNRIASMSCSGGEASLIADLSVHRDLTFPAITPDHRALLRDTLNEYVAIDNPLDYHTFIWGDETRMTATFSAMLAGRYDLTVLIIDYPYINDCDMTDWLSATRAFISACNSTGCKGAVVTCLAENYTKEVRDFLIENGVAPLQGMEQALAAIEALAHVGKAWAETDAGFPLLSFAGNCNAADGLDEFEAKQLLAKQGANIPASAIASLDNVADAAGAIGYPLVLKAVAKQIAHKSELGAVVTGIGNEQQLMEHAKRLSEISDTLLVEEMVSGAVAELLVGVSHDSLFGHYLIVGFGGGMVELINDREILFFPLNRELIIAALKKLKTWPLLDGFRGAEKADINGVVDCALALSALLKERATDIVEIEINPLMVKPEGAGAVVADALVRTVKRSTDTSKCQ